MINSMTSDLYAKVEKVIRDHIEEHQGEVRKGKELMNKLDIARLNTPTQDYSYDLTATGEKIEHSKYYYDYDRNDPNRPNPFKQYTVTSGASSYNPTTGMYWYSPEAQGTWPDYTEIVENPEFEKTWKEMDKLDPLTPKTK